MFFAVMGDVGDITTNFGYAEGRRVDSMSGDEKSQPTTLQGREGNPMGVSEGGKVVQGWVDEWTAIIMADSVFQSFEDNAARE